VIDVTLAKPRRRSDPAFTELKEGILNLLASLDRVVAES
jgi:hypothetical protein